MFLKGLRLLWYLCLVLGAVVYPLASNNVPGSGAFAHSLAAQRYTLDASQRKFIAHALRGGLFWFKGHDHLVAVREFTGEAQLNADSIAASSLVITARTASIEETSSAFTDAQKKIARGDFARRQFEDFRATANFSIDLSKTPIITRTDLPVLMSKIYRPQSFARPIKHTRLARFAVSD